ncbi:hypothetical protein Taro_015258 [Colocasia esculenta]|uniref:Aminotransferase-like plant mobile domain-containing protein n=1 Tax=Colocasia esculenta TaxID=4460 RepID=A0A843UGW0_COLES|nr:hypothetical protein [Colocasia esculenta]
MEGGGDGGDGASGRRRTKKTIRHRQADEGTSMATREDPPAVPMEEDTAAEVPGEDEPVGPKKSELRSRLGWAVVRAIYRGLPNFQRARLEEMRFGPFLRLEELAPDVALIQALKERWDPECHAFLFPWGQMIPTLEDVVRITDLRVDGQAVTGLTYTSYQELAERLLGLAVTRERSSLIPRMGLQPSLGVASARHETGESQADYMTQMTEDARAALAEEEVAAADRDLRLFLILVIEKLILGIRGDPVNCRCLLLLEDLSRMGNYAWGCGRITTSLPWVVVSRDGLGPCPFYDAGGSAGTSSHCAGRFSGIPMSGRMTPPSRGWSGAVPTLVGTFGFIHSTQWYRSTTG